MDGTTEPHLEFSLVREMAEMKVRWLAMSSELQRDLMMATQRVTTMGTLLGGHLGSTKASPMECCLDSKRAMTRDAMREMNLDLTRAAKSEKNLASTWEKKTEKTTDEKTARCLEIRWEPMKVSKTALMMALRRESRLESS